MYQKVSVLVPTRGRIARLRTLISSFDRTTGNKPSAELVFRADDDDVETLEFLYAWGGHKVLSGPRLKGYRSLPTFFNELAEQATGDILMCGNDDMVFKTEGWPEKIVTAANRYPDGLFDFGVTTFNQEHYPFSIVSKRVVEVLGALWDPRISWGDIYLRDIMQEFGRTELLPHIEIEHDWAGFNPDRVWVDGDQQDPALWSAAYWTDVHAPAVAEAVAKLREALL